MKRIVIVIILIQILSIVLHAQHSHLNVSTLNSFHDSNANPGCQKIIALPEPAGPYQIGSITYHWLDSRRKERVTDDPSDFRQVIAQIYYPARRVKDVPQVVYAPDLEKMREALKADKNGSLNEIAEDLTRYGCVAAHAYPEAMVDNRLQTYPVLIFSPGGNVSRHWHTALFEELASKGYIIAAISHAYSGMDVFPSGGLLRSHPYWQGTDKSTREEKERLDEELTNTLAGDARFVLDQLTSLNRTDPTRRFKNRLNLNQVAILGHSRGGSTVGRACSSDPRFKACVVYDNIGPEHERETGLSQPQLALRTPWAEERKTRLHKYLGRNRTHAYDVVIEGATHFSFTDLPLFDPKYLTKDISPTQALSLTTAYTLAFLDKYLRGKQASILDEPQQTLKGTTVRVFG